jgi:hypothetical protein
MLDNFREWLSDNLRYVLLGLAVILVVIIGICIFRLIGGSSSKKSDSGKQTTPPAASQEEQQSSEETKNVNLSAPAAGESLTENDEKLLDLINPGYKY